MLAAMSESRFKELFDRAMRAKNDERYSDAAELLEQALASIDEHQQEFLAATHGMLGYCHKQLAHDTESEHHYRRATTLSPRSELASLGLFHTLVNQDRWDEALAEAVRFVGVADSPQYRELLTPGFCEGLPPPLRALALEAASLMEGP
jgi:tetratricopeptide (TPR) repeat protein